MGACLDPHHRQQLSTADFSKHAASARLARVVFESHRQVDDGHLKTWDLRTSRLAFRKAVQSESRAQQRQLERSRTVFTCLAPKMWTTTPMSGLQRHLADMGACAASEVPYQVLTTGEVHSLSRRNAL